MRQNIIVFSVLLLTSFYSIGQAVEATTSNGKKVNLFQNGTWEYIEKGQNWDSVYIDIPFKKVINDAFASENENRKIKIKTRFGLIHSSSVNSKMPYNFRNNSGFVGFVLRDYDDKVTQYIFCTIAKDKSDIIFNLKYLDPIIIWAQLVPLKNE